MNPLYIRHLTTKNFQLDPKSVNTTISGHEYLSLKLVKQIMVWFDGSTGSYKVSYTFSKIKWENAAYYLMSVSICWRHWSRWWLMNCSQICLVSNCRSSKAGNCSSSVPYHHVPNLQTHTPILASLFHSKSYYLSFTNLSCFFWSWLEKTVYGKPKRFYTKSA